MVNALLLVALIRRRKTAGKSLAVFALSAIVAVGAFLPWIVSLLGQMSWVSSNFWITFEFPETVLQLAFYPVLTQAISDAFEGVCGLPWQVLMIVLIVAAVVFAVWAIVSLVKYLSEQRASRMADSPSSDSNPRAANPAVCALAAYAGVFAIAGLAGIVLDQMVLYYRYLYVGSVFVIFAFAYYLACINVKALTACSVALTLCFASVHQFLTFNSYYYGGNWQVLSAYQEMVEEAENSNWGEALVLSSDIGIAGVIAAQVPDTEITYLDVYNTAAAYEAYAPTVTIVDEWDSMLESYEGQFVVLMTDADWSSFESFAEEHDATVVDMQTYYHSYDDMDYCIAILQK